MTSPARDATTPDLELIAQRVLKLAEIATLEHIESLLRGQAGDVLEMAGDREQPAAAHAA
jgi:hypothetical protein